MEEQDNMTLTATIGIAKETITMSARMGPLDQVLEVIERFIRASGYCPEGRLTFTKEEDQ